MRKNAPNGDRLVVVIGACQTKSNLMATDRYWYLYMSDKKEPHGNRQVLVLICVCFSNNNNNNNNNRRY